jgi:hypothetical protein
MSDEIKTKAHAPRQSHQERAAHFKRKSLELQREVNALNRELRDARNRFYAEGSAETLAALYRKLGDDDLLTWFSDKYMGRTVRKPPFHLHPEVEARVRRETEDLLRRMGIKSRGPSWDMKELVL